MTVEGKDKNLPESDHLTRSNELLDHFLNDAFTEFQKNGGLENNPYKGKPLPLSSDHGDENAALNSILKNANILPPWLELQKAIRDQIKVLIDKMPTLSDAQVDAELTQINNQVKKYNLICPPPFQRVRIFKDIIHKQYEKWC